MASKSFWQNKTVLITGASSGIGEALAVELARHGARMGLFARREQRIAALARQIRTAGAWALALPGDVREREQVEAAVARLERESGPIDVLIANAGRGMHGQDETSAAVVEDVYAVNFFGAVYAFEAVLSGMRARGGGRIAIVSSGTALLPKLAASATYASSKAALGRYFEGLGGELRPEGIVVTTIYPGFVRTEMTSGHKFMPFALEADHAARVIRRAIEKGKRRYLFPRRTFWLGRVAQLVPTGLQVRVRGRFAGTPKKG